MSDAKFSIPLMKATFRATTPADQVPLSDLLAQAFDVRPTSSLLDPAVLDWKYWKPRQDWDEPRSYVLENDGRMVAHAGIWPVIFPKERVRGVQMIDWCATKGSPGAGLALVQKLAGMFDFMYSIGGSDQTRKVLPAFGFAEVAKAWTAARPLRPLRQILTHQTVNWKLAPRLVRNLLWSKSSDASAPGWRTVKLNPSDIPSELIASSETTQFSPRPAEFFEYLLQCPSVRYQLHGIAKEEDLQGYFALGVLRGQARVGGVWLRNPSQEHWRIAYALAQEVARRLPGAYEIAATGSQGPSGQAATECGLRIIRNTPVYVLNKKGKFTLPKDFQFQMTDDDAAFLDLGVSSYYT